MHYDSRTVHLYSCRSYSTLGFTHAYRPNQGTQKRESVFVCVCVCEKERGTCRNMCHDRETHSLFPLDSLSVARAFYIRIQQHRAQWALPLSRKQTETIALTKLVLPRSCVSARSFPVLQNRSCEESESHFMNGAQKHMCTGSSFTLYRSNIRLVMHSPY